MIFCLDALTGFTNNMSLVWFRQSVWRTRTQELDLVPLESCLLLFKLRLSWPLEDLLSSAEGKRRSSGFAVLSTLHAIFFTLGFLSVLAKASEYSPGLPELRGDRCPATEAALPMRGLRISSCLSGSLDGSDYTNFLIASSRYCSKHLKNSASCGPFHFISRSRLSLALLCL